MNNRRRSDFEEDDTMQRIAMVVGMVAWIGLMIYALYVLYRVIGN